MRTITALAALLLSGAVVQASPCAVLGVQVGASDLPDGTHTAPKHRLCEKPQVTVEDGYVVAVACLGKRDYRELRRGIVDKYGPAHEEGQRADRYDGEVVDLRALDRVEKAGHALSSVVPPRPPPFEEALTVHNAEVWHRPSEGVLRLLVLRYDINHVAEHAIQRANRSVHKVEWQMEPAEHDSDI